MSGENKEHWFFDEAGDSSFFGEGKRLILGTEGVSNCFGLGMVKINRPLDEVRHEIVALQKSVENHADLARMPSVKKRISKGGFFFHACKDAPPVRSMFFNYLSSLPCSADVVMARKIPRLFSRKHHDNQDEFYADILSHLIKNRLKEECELVLTIADRGSSTRAINCQAALEKATTRATARWGDGELKATAVFNVQTPLTDPLLCVADYLCWTVQRVFERGETTFYDAMKSKIRVVVDLYDHENYEGFKNCYFGDRNPLTAKNKIGPQTT